MVRLTRRITSNKGDAIRPRQVSDPVWQDFRQFKAGITGRKGEVAVQHALARLHQPSLHDVLVPDETGLTQIDHLVLSSSAILVIETKTYGGIITGLPGGAEWFQDLQGGSVRTPFQNPLRQNFRHVAAVEGVLRRAGILVPVCGHVVSAGRATFTAELASVVVSLPRLATILQGEPAVSAGRHHLVAAWEVLGAVTAQTAHRRDEHRAAVAVRPKATPPWGG